MFNRKGCGYDYEQLVEKMMVKGEGLEEVVNPPSQSMLFDFYKDT